MPRFSSIFLPFLVNQSQKHKHKLISSKNKNTNTNPATNLPCQRNIKATNTNPVRSKQLKTVSSKCSSRALPLVLFFPFQIVEINYFFYFIYKSLTLSLSLTHWPLLSLSHTFCYLSLFLSQLEPPWTNSSCATPSSDHRSPSLKFTVVHHWLYLPLLFFFFTVRHPRPKP